MLISMVDSPTRRSNTGERSMMSTRNAGFFCKSSVAVAAPESAPPMMATSYPAVPVSAASSSGICEIIIVFIPDRRT